MENTYPLVYRCCMFGILLPKLDSIGLQQSLYSHNMTSAQARPLLVSADDYSSAITIIAWVFLVTTFFGVAARLSTRYAISRNLKTDDLLIVFALVRLSDEHTVLMLNAEPGS